MLIVPKLLLISAAAFIPAACIRNVVPSLPQTVTVDAGAPLTCTLLPQPKTIGQVTALYGCATPGAYLSSIDTQKMETQYFTTNSQGDTVTYGPVTKPLLSITP
jgi:hypothetical protein